MRYTPIADGPNLAQFRLFTGAYRGRGWVALERELVVALDLALGLGGAVSTSERKQLDELLRWFHVFEGGARTVVQTGREAGEICGGVH